MSKVEFSQILNTVETITKQNREQQQLDAAKRQERIDQRIENVKIFKESGWLDVLEEIRDSESLTLKREKTRDKESKLKELAVVEWGDDLKSNLLLKYDEIFDTSGEFDVSNESIKTIDFRIINEDGEKKVALVHGFQDGKVKLAFESEEIKEILAEKVSEFKKER